MSDRIGPRQSAEDTQMEAELREWPHADPDAYRKAMRGTLAYQAAVLADAMEELIYAHPITRGLVALRLIKPRRNA